MSICPRITALGAALLLALGSTPEGYAQALTSAFTYQGELRSAGTPASANFDMEFRLFRSADGADQIGATVTRTSVPVSGGLFSVSLDFGAAQFAGDRQWLEVRIRPAGSGSFETLSPRTEVTAAPYAWSAAVALANSVTSTSIVDGSIGSVDINATQVQRRVTGSCPTGQYLRVVNQDGSVTCGSDAGGSVTSIATGAGLAGGPISTSGTISIANGGVGATQIDSSQVQRRISGSCTVGQYVRVVNQDGSVACGTDAVGTPGWSLTGNAGTNSETNFVGTTDAQPLVMRAGNQQVARLEAISLTGPAGGHTANVLLGSRHNQITAGVRGATIAGGGVQTGDSDPSYFLESPNRVTDHYGSIGGGYANRAGDADSSPANNAFATVGGGLANTASGVTSTVSGGERNAAGGQSSTVGGGTQNTASVFASTVGGGRMNNATGPESTVGGGGNNRASNFFSTVGGGDTNVATAIYGTVGGGILNAAIGGSSTVGGGAENTASGSYSTVTGGVLNCAGGLASWAGGVRAKVRPPSAPAEGSCRGLPSYPGGSGDAGTFIWADSQEADFVSSGPNQFLVRAQGGIGLNSNGPPPGIDLEVRNREGTGSSNVDIYLRTAAHNRGINLAMLPTAGAAEFRISQSTGTGFSDRLIIQSDGDFEVTAQAFKPGGGAWANPSDARLKSDVATLSGALDRLLSLRGVEYHYLKDRTPVGMYLPGAQIGFIAQEVETVFPDWVGETGTGYKTVGPRGFEALTVEALRELRAESATLDRAQDRRIATLEAENTELRQRLARLEALLDR